MNIKPFIRANKLNFAILLFMVLFSIVHYVKPAMIYDSDGSFRQFGLGYKQKTIVPIWIVAICLAILSYMAVLYYLIC